ncbi:hypothetical protein N0V94_007801 [Neodidymelliopsis sp. IMI 364377]|nr:hypothetical protein N0V94_007801 [Neodidymelliopsis sp. IMI 364377]
MRLDELYRYIRSIRLGQDITDHQHYLAKAVEVINYIDSTERHNASVSQKVDECCAQIEALVTEWKMEPMLEDQTLTLPLRCLVADHIMNMCAVIIGLKRLASRIDGTHTVDAMTVRAARKLVKTLLEFEQTDHLNDDRRLDHTQIPALRSESGFFSENLQPEILVFGTCFMLFYPFCAVFTLYEHIMACSNPDDCEADVRQLEHVGDAMENTSNTVRSDLKPFSNTIKALNKVSRTIQDGRRNKRPATAQDQSVDRINAQQQQDNLINMPIPDLDLSAFDHFPDFPMTMDGDPDPLGFVRAMENDFIGRNWHDNWWDMGGGMDSGVMYMAGR